MNTFVNRIAGELQLLEKQIQAALKLFEDGATIPFVARYRKEATGSLDEVQLTAIRDRYNQWQELEKRRKVILESVEEQGKLTEELKAEILNAQVMSVLEDLYLPYRPKRKTRATIAIAKGLEPLAVLMKKQLNIDLEKEAEKFLNDEVKSVDEALSGASDIVAEWICEDINARERIRKLYLKEAYIYSKVQKNKEDEAQKYQNYFDWSEVLSKAPSHRVLAMFRAEDEGFLKLKIEPDEDEALNILDRIFSVRTSFMEDAVKDAYKRLLSSQIETEIRALIKEKADKEAIRVFAENLRQLLLAPPLGKKNVLAIDPGFRTGCKVVCLDRLGNLLHNETIYPHPPENKMSQAMAKIYQMVEAYKIEAIAIGNGTAGRETEDMIHKMKFKTDVIAVMVNESGASVYSASSVAREEFPDYDVTVRGAVSIGRRLMDPLAELVKIDPKSIGVGQYQHDVDQKLLKASLEDTVVSSVNKVGVEINSASKELLSYVSGVGDTLAQNIVNYRKENGAFKSRTELKKIPRFGPKAFEQAAGFLRISDAKNPLDRSAVHPESYAVVEKMAKDQSITIEQLMTDKEKRTNIKLTDYVNDKTGMPTLNDIMKELDKPGRDPRQQFEIFEFDKNITKISDLVPGMELNGIVTNITAFGAFVDIGVHQDGLVHKSMMADRFVSDPNEVVKLNQHVKVRVIDVDIPRKRIQLSMKRS